MKLHLPTSLRVALLAAMVSLAAPSLWAAPTWGTYPTVFYPMDSNMRSFDLSTLSVALDSTDWQMDISVTGAPSSKKESITLLPYYEGNEATACFTATTAADGSTKWVTSNLASGFGLMLYQGQLLVGYKGIITNPEPGYEGLIKYGSYSGKLGSTGSDFDVSVSWLKDTQTLSITLNGEEVFSKDGISMTLGAKNNVTAGAEPEGSSMELSVTMKGDNYAWIVSDAEGTLSELDLSAHDTQDFYFEGKNGVLNVTENATLSGQIMAGAPIGSKEEAVVGFNISSGVTLTSGVNSGAEKYNLVVQGGGTLELRGTEAISMTKSLSLLNGSSLVFNGADGSVVFGKGSISSTSSISSSSGHSLTVGLGGVSTSLTTLSAGSDLMISGKGSLNANALTAASDGKIVVGVSGGRLTAQSMEAGNVELYAGSIEVGTITGNVLISGANETSCVVKADSISGNVTLNGGRLEAAETRFGGSVTVAGGYAAFGDRTGFALTQSGGTSVFGSLTDSTLTISNGAMQTESVQNLTIKYTYQGANWASVTETALSGVTTTERFVWNGATFGTSGTMQANAVYLMNGLTLQAHVLSVETLGNLTGAIAGGAIAVDTLRATTVNLDGNDYGGSIADPLSVRAGELSMTTLTNLGGLSGSAVKMTGADLHLNQGSFATLGDASGRTTLAVADGYILSGNTSTALISNTDLTVGEGTTLRNFRVSGDSTITATGQQTLDAVTFVRGYDGYTQATTYALRAATPGSVFVVSDQQGLDSVTVTGTAQADGLHISRLIINGTGLAFSEGASNTYTIFDSGVAEFENEALISLSDPDGYLLNIAPFVQASLALDATNGSISLTGQNRTTEIVQELSDAPNRTTVLSNMLSTYRDDALSDEMLAVFNYAGNINDPSVTMADRQQALSAASGASLVSLTDAQRRGVGDVQKNIRNRVVQMGGGAEGLLHDGWVSAGLQAWAQADGAYHSLSQKQDVAGYDYSVYGTTIGANVDLTPHWVVGGALSAEFGSLDGKGSDHLDADINSYYLNFFARYQKGHWTHLGIFTIGFDDIDTNRKVLGYSADGSTSGSSFSGYYELGYLIPLNEEGTQLIQPIVSLSLTAASLSGFTESGSIGNAGLKYDSQDLLYGDIGVGARYQAVIGSSADGRNSVLELRAQINEHFGDKTDEAELSFIGGGQKMRVKGTDSGSFGVQIGAGLSVPVGVSTTLFTDADAEFVSDYTDVRVNLGLRYDF